LIATMRQHLALSLLTICLCGCAALGGGRPKPDAVVVEVLDEPLPSDESQRRGFLWDTFANKPEEEQFESYKTGKWQERFAAFANHLTQKAQSQGLDAASLQQALDKMLDHADEAAIALLPVGAYQTTLDRMPVWIVVAKWEHPGFADRLIHIRIFAFDQETLDLVGLATCT
jgi:hypothetical protein